MEKLLEHDVYAKDFARSMAMSDAMLEEGSNLEIAVVYAKQACCSLMKYIIATAGCEVEETCEDFDLLRQNTIEVSVYENVVPEMTMDTLGWTYDDNKAAAELYHNFANDLLENWMDENHLTDEDMDFLVIEAMSPLWENVREKCMTDNSLLGQIARITETPFDASLAWSVIRYANYGVTDRVERLRQIGRRPEEDE